jgi:hypothetical protein
VALRSGFEFSLPLAGYATIDDRRGEQEAKYRAFAAQFTSLLRPGKKPYQNFSLWTMKCWT